jgi:hypothetical protein
MLLADYNFKFYLEKTKEHQYSAKPFYDEMQKRGEVRR